MSAVLLFAAKRAVIDALASQLADVQVEYSFPANPERTLVYAAGARFTRQQALAEWASAADETTVVDIWLRVVSPGDDTRAADGQLEELAAAVLDVLSTHRDVGSGLTFNDVTAGTAPEPLSTPNPEPTITVRLLMQVSVRGVVV